MYLKWDEITIDDFSDENIQSLYNQGYLFGRQEKGKMYQTRSVRIDLSEYESSSENRRILRKTEEIEMSIAPLPYDHYHWSIGKMAKDFYDTKFGEGVFSANKAKELLTSDESNFNQLLLFSPYQGELERVRRSIEDISPLGYCVALETNDILHYSYPFYDLEKSSKNMGMGMMVRAVEYAKESGKQYIYLGSAQRPGDTYKMQFKGLEWFDGEGWTRDLEELKDVLKS